MAPNVRADIQFAPTLLFSEQAVTDYRDHAVGVRMGTFGVTCLFTDAIWDESVRLTSCDGQEFKLATDDNANTVECE